jgi:heme/copper-type cytochrome/quinol oxidase subunit 3
MAKMSENMNGEVHGSIQPFLNALGITLLLAGLLIWPLIPLGLVLVVYSSWRWINEEVELWPKRSNYNSDTYPATIIIVITEALIFGVFFTFWFWARFYSTDAGNSWPPPDVDFNLGFVAFNSVLLFLSGYTASQYLKSVDRSLVWLQATILLGLLFLFGQIYEYYTLYNEGLTQKSSFGTAFFALTGIHGLHVLVGIIVLSILYWLVKSNSLNPNTQLPESVVFYWHFVDAIWILILFVIYLEVI